MYILITAGTDLPTVRIQPEYGDMKYWKMIYTYNDIAEIVEPHLIEIMGDKELLLFNNIASVNSRNEHSLDWTRKIPDIMKYVGDSCCRAFIISTGAKKYLKDTNDKLFLIVDDPL